MTQFRVTSVAAVVLIAVAAALSYILSTPLLLPYVAVPVIVIHQSLYIYGMFSERSNYFFRTVKGKDYFEGEPGILFRFDDGPNPVYTPRVLDILKSEGLKALFAVTGKNAEKYPAIVERIRREGHVIGNHTYSHPYNILLMGYKEVRAEIERANAVIERITGEKVKYFCPPIGHKNFIIAKAVRDLGMTPVMWDIRTLDTRRTAEKIFNKIKRKLKPPSIILMHDAVEPWGGKDREATVAALKKTIDFIREKGLI